MKFDWTCSGCRTKGVSLTYVDPPPGWGRVRGRTGTLCAGCMASSPISHHPPACMCAVCRPGAEAPPVPPGRFVVRVRGADAPWASNVDAPAAMHAFREALEHGIGSTRILIHRLGDASRELKPTDYPWDDTSRNPKEAS
jgi:hypothetical protein